MNTKYKFALDNRRSRTFIHNCPRCEKRTFRRYVDTTTYKEIAEEVGKCERLNKCGYHLPPREYFQTNPDRRKDFADTHVCLSNNSLMPKSRQCLHFSAVEKCMMRKQPNAFTCWLQHIINDSERFEQIKNDYYLSSAHHGGIIFWQIDRANIVRTGKIMQYDQQTGKRIKNSNRPAFNWVHSILIKQKLLSEKTFELQQCLFGEHLLSHNPNTVVGIFESEKTAVVAASWFPNLTCLATGGCQGLNVDKCRALIGRHVIFFPDINCYDEWSQKVEQIAQSIAFASYSVSQILELEATEKDRTEGLDLCDFIVRNIQEQTNL